MKPTIPNYKGGIAIEPYDYSQYFIMEDGEANTPKIDALCGVITSALFQDVQNHLLERGAGTMSTLSQILTQLYSNGQEAEIVGILLALFCITGTSMPPILVSLLQNPVSRVAYLFSFVQDFDKCAEQPQVPDRESDE